MGKSSDLAEIPHGSAVTGTATPVAWVLAYKAHGRHTIRRAMITWGSKLPTFPRIYQGAGSIRHTTEEDGMPGRSARSPHPHFIPKSDARREHPPYERHYLSAGCGRVQKAGSLLPRDHGTRVT